MRRGRCPDSSAASAATYTGLYLGGESYVCFHSYRILGNHVNFRLGRQWIFISSVCSNQRSPSGGNYIADKYRADTWRVSGGDFISSSQLNSDRGYIDLHRHIRFTDAHREIERHGDNEQNRNIVHAHKILAYRRGD